MSIASSDIKFYGSATMPDDDTTVSVGGGIDIAKKVEFTDISPSGTVEMLSSAGGDTSQTVTIYGRNGAGEAISESKMLNGTNIVQFSSAFERILKVIMSSTAIGTITIRKTGIGSSLMTLEPGITQVRRPFYNAMSPSTGTRRYYEKVFCKNTNDSLTLTSAVIKEYADPSGKVAFGVAVSLNDTAVVTNRLTAPAGIVFDSNDKNIANNQNLSSGSAQGIWLELTLTSNDLATKTTYTLRCEGNTV